LKSYEKGEQPQVGSVDALDFRQFLLCFENRLNWRVLYYAKEDQYEVWFSMPQGFMYGYGFLHYVIKKENGKLLLIGF